MHFRLTPSILSRRALHARHHARVRPLSSTPHPHARIAHSQESIAAAAYKSMFAVERRQLQDMEQELADLKADLAALAAEVKELALCRWMMSSYEQPLLRVRVALMAARELGSSHGPVTKALNEAIDIVSGADFASQSAKGDELARFLKHALQDVAECNKTEHCEANPAYLLCRMLAYDSLFRRVFGEERGANETAPMAPALTVLIGLLGDRLQPALLQLAKELRGLWPASEAQIRCWPVLAPPTPSTLSTPSTL